LRVDYQNPQEHLIQQYDPLSVKTAINKIFKSNMFAAITKPEKNKQILHITMKSRIGQQVTKP